jgi:hypothetical protein
MSIAPMPLPIFIHSSFRTSSTWLWSKFRANRAVVAYYECFHENLQSMSEKDVGEMRPDAWGSGHPDVEPYFIEYLPLIRKPLFRKSGGVKRFQECMAFANFFPAAGYDGSLSKAEADYINLLVANAARRRRAPYIFCKRSLGRVRALKRAMGGVHIVLQRKLLDQWCSYSEQARGGNFYFLRTLVRVVALNEHEPFMAFLGDFIRSLPGGSKDIQASELDNDDLFVVFVALHFYLYLLTLDDANLVIKASDLVNADYRRTVESQLLGFTGLTIDLSDAREGIRMPRRLLFDREKVRPEIERLCARALLEADRSVSQAEGCRHLLDELWADERDFSAHDQRT